MKNLATNTAKETIQKLNEIKERIEEFEAEVNRYKEMLGYNILNDIYTDDWTLLNLAEAESLLALNIEEWNQVISNAKI